MSVEERTQHTHHHHEHHEHHHHHHHHQDDATRFKRNALSSIRRRKLFAKWLFRALWIIAGILAIAVVVVYSL